mgnify:CR=1 FL=1
MLQLQLKQNQNEIFDLLKDQASISMLRIKLMLSLFCRFGDYSIFESNPDALCYAHFISKIKFAFHCLNHHYHEN